MARLLRNSLLIAFAGFATVVGCGDDETRDSSDGAGAAGATSSGSAGSTGTGATGGAADGGGGSGPASCTEITVDNFKLAISQGPFAYGGVPTPALGGADGDRFQLEVYDEMLTGSVDLATGDQANYEKCAACVLVYEDIADGAPSKIYFQSGGTLALGATAPPFIEGKLNDVTLVEVTIDPETFASTPVSGGSCLHLDSLDVAIVPPPAGWTCLPEWYEDVISCDCECGILDPDCADTALPIYNCEAGQTCSADGTTCEGVPTAWTCAADQYGGGPANGCDCNCGTHDPDCDLAGEVIEGCQPTDTCNAAGFCLPAAWTCDDDYFGDVYCDCGCGVVDVDCPDATVGSCEFCNGMGSCSTTDCPGTINATNNGVCG